MKQAHIYIIILVTIFGVIFPFKLKAGNRQEINDFYLSNLRADGASDWEIEGKNAIVNGDLIEIATMKANYYLENNTISVKSNNAKLNTKSQDMFLDGNVEIYNQEGWNLKTDYLDWQRSKNYLQTTSPVKTKQDSLIVKAVGLQADSQLNKADFQKEVEVTFSDKDKNNATTINCDGPLEIEYASGKATFKNNVIVEHSQGKLFSDKATLFFDTSEEKIIKIISEGNVKIVRDSNITLAEKATYLADKETLILEGSPRLIYFPGGEQESSSGFFGID